MKNKLFLGVSIVVGVIMIVSSIILYDHFITQNRSAKSDKNSNSTNEDYSKPLSKKDREEEVLSEESSSDSGESLKDIRERVLNEETIDETTATQIQESGWIPNWDFNSGVSSVTNSGSKFSVIMPVWYALDSEGGIVDNTNGNKSTLLLYAKRHNIKILPSIASFSADDFAAALGSEEKYQKHKEALIAEVLNNNYDGLDLDYESIALTEKEYFLRLVKDLSEEFDKHNKILSVTVISKWSDLKIYDSLPQTRESQDWEYIGKYAHQFRIMTYDYTSIYDEEPGPIGPYDWQIRVLNYAVKKVPREKIWLGVHLYGYEWVEGGYGGSGIYSNFKKNLPTLPNIEMRYLDTYQEGYATYDCYEGDKCTLYYMTPEGIEARRKLAQSYGIAGLTYWKLGGEGDLLD